MCCVLPLTGTISSNGESGVSYTDANGAQMTGGASGGSIWISADSFGGGGVIEANGGDSSLTGM